MDTATEPNNNNKRVRFDPTAASAKTQQVSPTDAAKSTAAAALASLPTTIQALGKSYHKEFIDLRRELVRLEKTKARLSKDDYIPVSARLNFDLGASQRVKETKAEEFNTLVEEAKYKVWSFQQELKQILLKTVELERGAIQVQIKNLVAKAAMTLGLAIGIAHRDIPREHTREIAYFTYELEHERLLVHTEFDLARLQEFFDTMKRVTGDERPAHIYAESIDWNIRSTHQVHQQYYSVMYNLFPKSWTDYLTVVDDRQQQLDLEEFITTLQVSKATEDVAMAVEETTPNTASLQDTINEAVSKQTRKLQNQIKELQKQVKAPKNSVPGATKPTNKNNNKTRPVTNKNASKNQRFPNQNGQKAEDSDNDSTSASKKSATTNQHTRNRNSRNNKRNSKTR